MHKEQLTENIVHNLIDVENLTILVGTGLAKACGGQTMDDISKKLVSALNQENIDDDIQRWSHEFLTESNSNFESFFNALLIKKKYLESINKNDTSLEKVILLGKKIIFEACSYIPTNNQLKPLLRFIKCITERKSGLSRVNLFSLNYDLLIENTCDRLGVLVTDGFEGSVQRKFNPSAFDLDYYYPSGIVSIRPTRCEKVINLIKLHGSINWALEDNYIIKTTSNPDNMFIYPSHDKLDDTLLNPFSEVFRRFSLSNKRYKNGLLIIGYGFLDSHVNSLLLQAIEQPNSFMVIVDPKRDSWKTKFSALEIHLNKIHFINEKFEDFCENYLPKKLHIIEPKALESISEALIEAIKKSNTAFIADSEEPK